MSATAPSAGSRLFGPATYAERRAALAALLPGALLLFLGNDDVPLDFAGNSYPFRQDACFRYFFGLDRPLLAGLVDADEARSRLFGDDPPLEAAIWFGSHERLADQAEAVGILEVGSLPDLATELARAGSSGRRILYPRPYRDETRVRLARLLGVPVQRVDEGASAELGDAVIALRECKSAEEVAELETGMAVTRLMHIAAMRSTRVGRMEREIVAEVERVARAAGSSAAYAPVLTRRGEVLHNLSYDGVLADGDLVVHDSGALSPGGYASDITRTLPANGRFGPMQRKLYGAVLKAQLAAIQGCRPGMSFLDLHLGAARSLVEDLGALGLFRGAPDAVVESGAYALCFQTGLGHPVGLDTHDMESLGEDRVGYGDHFRRSPLFGLSNLRFAKHLKPGMVLTVEPGVYFIPRQIDAWRAEGRHAELIDYDRFEEFRSFGGIRIEDDVLITDGGARVLGAKIPKTPDEVEFAMTEER